MPDSVRSAQACADGEASRNKFFSADSSASRPQSLSRQPSRHCPMSSACAHGAHAGRHFEGEGLREEDRSGRITVVLHHQQVG